jgi:hypothetical protein
MIGTFLTDDAVGGTGRSDGLEALLEFSFWVHLLGLGEDLVHKDAEIAEEKPARGLESAIDVDRPGKRFKGVREIRGPATAAAGEFAFAEEEVGSELKAVGEEVERLTRDETAAQLREAALTFARVTSEEFFGEDELNHGVAEVFEPLVIRLCPFRLAGETGVREGFREEGEIGKAVADLGLDGIHGRKGTRFPRGGEGGVADGDRTRDNRNHNPGLCH